MPGLWFSNVVNCIAAGAMDGKFPDLPHAYSYFIDNIVVFLHNIYTEKQKHQLASENNEIRCRFACGAVFLESFYFVLTSPEFQDIFQKVKNHS